MDCYIEDLARTLETVAAYSRDCDDLLIQFRFEHPNASEKEIYRAALFAATRRQKLEKKMISLLRDLALRRSLGPPD